MSNSEIKLTEETNSHSENSNESEIKSKEVSEVKVVAEEEEKLDEFILQETLEQEAQKNSNHSDLPRPKTSQKTYFARRYESNVMRSPKRRKFNPELNIKQQTSSSAPCSPVVRHIKQHEKPSLPPKREPVRLECHKCIKLSDDQFNELNKSYKSNLRPKRRFDEEDYKIKPIEHNPEAVQENIPKCYKMTEDKFERRRIDTLNQYYHEEPTIDSYLQKDFKPAYHTKSEKLKNECTRQKILIQQRKVQVEQLNEEMRRASILEAQQKMVTRPTKQRTIDNPEKTIRNMRTNMRNNYESYMNFINQMKDNLNKRQSLLERIENELIVAYPDVLVDE